MADIFETAREGAKLLMQLESLEGTPVVLRFDPVRWQWCCEIEEGFRVTADSPCAAVEHLWQMVARRNAGVRGVHDA